MGYVFRRPWFDHRRIRHAQRGVFILPPVVIPQKVDLSVTRRRGVLAGWPNKGYTFRRPWGAWGGWQYRGRVALSTVFVSVDGVFAIGAAGSVITLIGPDFLGVNATGLAQSGFAQDTRAISGAFSSGASSGLTPDGIPAFSGIDGVGAADSLTSQETRDIGGGATGQVATGKFTSTVPEQITAAPVSASAQPLVPLLPPMGNGVFGTGEAGIVVVTTVQPVDLTGVFGSGAVQGFTLIEANSALTGVFGTGDAVGLTSPESPTSAGVSAQGDANTIGALIIDVPPFVGISATGEITALTPEDDTPLTGIYAIGFGDFIILPRGPPLTGASGTADIGVFLPDGGPQPLGSNATGSALSLTPENDDLLSSAIATTQANSVGDEIDVSDLLGSFGTGSAVTLTVDGEPTPFGASAQGEATSSSAPFAPSIPGTFATGVSLFPSAIDFGVPLPSVFGTAIASVQFGPIGFFDGVATFADVGVLFASQSALEGGASAIALTGDVTPLDGIALGDVYGTAFAENAFGIEGVINVAGSSSTATGIAAVFELISSISSADSAATAAASALIEIDLGFSGVKASGSALIMLPNPSPYVGPVGSFATGNAVSIVIGLTFDSPGVEGAPAHGATATFSPFETLPVIIGISADGAATALTGFDGTPLGSTFVDTFASEFTPPGAISTMGAIALSGVSGSIEIVGPATLISVDAIGGVGQLAKETLLESAIAQGESQSITSFQLGDSPTLRGTQSTAIAGLLGILPTLTGIGATGIGANLEPTRTLASAFAFGEAEAIPEFYTTLIGVSAIGGSTLITITSVSLTTNNAVIIQSSTSAKIVGNQFTLNIIGTASKGPLG